MKKIGIALVSCIALITVIYYSQNPPGVKVRIKDTVFVTEVALTNAEKQKGLGYRSSLPADHAMLFPYDHEEMYTFWMKGMEFPLDILWIKDTTIVDITHNARVATGPNIPTYTPKEKVNKILEINAGLASASGIAIGDTIEIIDQ